MATRKIKTSPSARTLTSRKKLSNIKLLQILRNLNKPYFTVADLEKVLGLERTSLYVLLHRLVKNSTLVRLKRGVYQSEFQSLKLEKVANELYYPSYLSFESALSKYSILSQTPYVLTFATTKTTKRLNLGDCEVKYRQLKDDYFFGYALKNDIYIAEPEKAVLDQLYIVSRGKAITDTNEWSLIGLDRTKFLKYAKKFPKKVQKEAKRLVSRFGRYATTLEEKETIPSSSL